MTDEEKYKEECRLRGWPILIPEEELRKRYSGKLYLSMFVMNMVAWCSACLFVSAVCQEVPDLIYVAGVFFYYILIYAIRLFATKMWILVAGHILLYLPVVFYVTGTWEMYEEMAAFYLFMLTCSFISSIRIYQQGDEVNYYGNWAHAVEVAVIYLWGAFHHETNFTMAGLLLGITLLLIHYWCTYLSRFDDFTQEKRDVSIFFLERIFKLNTKCMKQFLLLAGILMLTTVLAQYDAWMAPFKHILLMVVRHVMRVVHLFLDWLRSLNHPTLQKTGEGDVGQLRPNETGFQTDNLFLAIIGGLAISTLFFLGLREFYLKLRDVLRKKKNVLQYQENMMDQIEDLSDEDDPFLRRLARRIFLDNRERVRAHFKHRVQRALNNAIRDSETAGRLQERVNASGKDQIDVLTALYQVARYSEQEITPADIRLAGKK